MLSRVFSGRGKEGLGRGRSMLKQKEKRVKEAVVEEGVDGSGLIAENRTLYSHKKPDEEVTLGQLIDNHEPGKFFPYVATTGEEAESPSARSQRIMRFIPLILKRAIKLPKRMNFNLSDELEHISLVKIAKGKVSMEFFSIPRIMFSFTSTMSIRSNFTDVYVSLVDSRFVGEKTQQRIILSSNKHYKGEMCIDYSIPTTSMDKIEFAVAPAIPVLNTGEIWGSIQVEIELRESDHPEVIPFKEVMATTALPKTGLEVYYRDPTRLNVAMTDDHMDDLRLLKDRGEIPDVGEAVVSSEGTMTYASSRVQSKPGVPKEPTYEDWEEIQKRKKTVQAQPSVTPPLSEESVQSQVDSDKVKEALELLKPTKPNFKVGFVM